MAQFDVKFIKPFVEGTLHTLKVQCHTDAAQEKPFLKADKPQLNSEIVAILGISCSAFSGTIALYFGKQTFLNLMSNMLGEKFEEITPDLQDGAAELMNMIYGHAKRVLNAEGHDLQKAIPSIIRGQNLQASHLTTAPVVVLPFKSNSGDFFIEISAGEMPTKLAKTA